MSPPTATTESIPDPDFLQSQKPVFGKKQGFPTPPVFEDKLEEREYLKGRLAAAFRIFGKWGFDEGVAGHITVRDPVEPTTFWVNPLGIHYKLMKRSDLIRVDSEGQVIDGGPVRLLNKAAYMIHHAVHVLRPDVICAAHSHTLYGRAFCALGKPLDIITQDSCAFWNDHVAHNSFRGMALVSDEGMVIAKALGNKKAALLQNHGILTVGATVEACIFWFISMEKCCRAQLLADAAGQTHKILDDHAEATFNTVGGPLIGWYSAKPEFDLIHHETGGDYLN